MLKPNRICANCRAWERRRGPLQLTINGFDRTVDVRSGHCAVRGTVTGGGGYCLKHEYDAATAAEIRASRARDD